MKCSKSKILASLPCLAVEAGECTKVAWAVLEILSSKESVVSERNRQALLEGVEMLTWVGWGEQHAHFRAVRDLVEEVCSAKQVDFSKEVDC